MQFPPRLQLLSRLLVVSTLTVAHGQVLEQLLGPSNCLPGYVESSSTQCGLGSPCTQSVSVTCFLAELLDLPGGCCCCPEQDTAPPPPPGGRPSVPSPPPIAAKPPPPQVPPAVPPPPRMPPAQAPVPAPAPGPGLSPACLAATPTPAGTQLYLFGSSFMFTNCGATGAAGPQNCYSAYTQPWTADSSFFSITGNGTQQWTVPQTGAYSFVVQGASGGGGGGGPESAGLGGIVDGTVGLQAGQTLLIVVGQAGPYSSTPYAGGGGGATFVLTADQSLLVAGGGGGANVGAPNAAGFTHSNAGVGAGAVDGLSSSGSDGSFGSGGQGGVDNGGGGGTVGQPPSNGTYLGGPSFAGSAAGGFGCGGGGGATSHGGVSGGGGGGGGWQGGGGSSSGLASTGGSSYANPSSVCSPSFALAAGPGNGSVSVTLLAA